MIAAVSRRLSAFVLCLFVPVAAISQTAALSDADRARITVRADRSVELGLAVQVIDALRKGGAEGISLPMVPTQQ